MDGNILILINTLERGGGAERIAAELGSQLEERNYKVTFLAVHDSENKYDFEGQYEYIYGPEEFEKKYSGLFGKASVALETQKRIKKVSEEKNISTIISFLDFSNINTILSKILFRNKPKTILSARNNPIKSNKGFLKRYTIKKLYKRADKVVALSKGVENALKEDFSLSNTTYIHNIQDVEKFRRLGKKEVNDEHKEIFKDGFIFINIGSLSEQKGHWHLLRSFKELSKKKDNVKLVVLGGDAGLSKELKNLTEKLNLEDKVFFLGTVNNVFPYLRSSDCFVLSSIWEGFGNVLTEALSQNLPVISTDCRSGPREILCPELGLEEEIDYPYYGEYGVLTEPLEDEVFFDDLNQRPTTTQEKMLWNTMKKVLEDKNLRKKYSEKSAKRTEDFHPEKIIEEWSNVISEKNGSSR